MNARGSSMGEDQTIRVKNKEGDSIIVGLSLLVGGGPHSTISRVGKVETSSDKVETLSDKAETSSDKAETSSDIVAFGPFILDPNRRQLFKRGTRVRLGSKALRLLIALIEKRGTVVSKWELLKVGWPSTHVEEGNLRVQVHALRLALGDRVDEPAYISTSCGEGYVFICEVRDPAGNPT
jgi:DNA-binding winged helix-turn-helix (wHTH) protein